MKKFLSIFLLLIISLSLASQERKKVGLVLSGGGAKGVAHIPVLKILEEEGIPVDYIAGTSMGAIIGGFYAIGYTPEQLDSLMMNQDWSFLLSDRTRRKMKTFEEKEQDSKYVITLPFHNSPKEVIPTGIIRGQNLENIFTAMTIGKHDSVPFNDFPIPFACVAVDLIKGEEVVFHSGRLVQCMRASMAIPGAFTPVMLDSMVLVDGGLVNNYPVDVARSMGADIIIGVDVQNEDEEVKINTVADIVGRMANMLSRDRYAENLKETDLHIKVDVEGYTAASFNLPALDTLMRRGKEAGESKRSELRALKRKIGLPVGYELPEHGPYPMLSKDNPMFIRDIVFQDVDNEEAAYLLSKTELKKNSSITMEDLQYAIDAIYSTQIYSNVNYGFKSVATNVSDLIFTLEQDITNSFGLGIRLDTEEVAAVLVNARFNFNTKVRTRAIATGRFGKRTGLRLDYEILPHPLRYFNISYFYQYNDINIYERGKREYSTTFDRHLAEIGYNNIFNQDLKLETGIRFEFFDYRNFLFKKPENEFRISSESFFSYYARLRYESMDKKTYPTRGTSMQANFSLYTNNPFRNDKPFGAVSLWWKTAITPHDRFSIIPAAFARVLIGNDTPYSYQNAVGGMIPGRYMEQQLPFAGVNYMEMLDNSTIVLQTQFRQRFYNKHYVFLTGNYGLTENSLGRIFKGSDLIGGNIGYAYDSLMGPIEASFNYSNRTKKVGFYLNIGFIF